MSGLTALVVDDAPDIRLLADLVLTMAGFKVRAAASGRDALRILAGPDLPDIVAEAHVPVEGEAPQVDVSVGFARASTANGPSSRGVASYLWPGDAVGDGLGVLLNEGPDAAREVAQQPAE